MRNLLSIVTRAAQQGVAVLVRTIFAQPDRASAMANLKDFLATLSRRFSP